MKKLHSTKRLKELKPYDTLRNIGVLEDSILFDYGAGTGVFTIPAAKITRNKIYAYDINDDMLEILNKKSQIEALNNVITLN